MESYLYFIFISL